MKNINKVLPTEIISDILARLPIESVFDCKLVCTTWKHLIQQPSFPRLHLARLDSTDSGKLRYVFLDIMKSKLFYFEYNEDEDWSRVKPIRRKFKSITTELDHCVVLIGSFNGLVCVYGEYEYDAMIFNPVTKEYIRLPAFDTKLYESNENTPWYPHLACGFGYLAETNEYKVVRMYDDEDAVGVDVYTVGSGKGWRHVGVFDLGFKFVVNGEDGDGYALAQGVFLNGCLHWRNVKGGMVVVFDLADEKFCEPIPPPPMFTYDDDDPYGTMVLGVSNGGILYYTGCLFVQQEEGEDEEEEEDKENICEVWLLMRKDDVMRGGQEEKQSWVWSIPISLEQTEPFAFKEHDIVLRYDQGDLKVSSSREYSNLWGDSIQWDYSEISRRVFPHKHTLISLKELGEEDAKIMRRFHELTVDEYYRKMMYYSDDD